MGNIFQKLFSGSSDSPKSSHNGKKLHFNTHSSKSKSQHVRQDSGRRRLHPTTAATELATSDSGQAGEPVLFRRSFKSPSIHAMHSVSLIQNGQSALETEAAGRIIFVDSLPSSHTSLPTQESSNSPQTTITQNDIPPSSIPANDQQPQSTTTPPADDQVRVREESPFHRDFLPPHQPLVGVEKSRPRRSNIRRSSRMNQSVGKGDNVERPVAGRNALSSVPSLIDEPDYDEEDEDDVVRRTPNVVSNRADPSVPVSHSNHNSAYWTHHEEDETEQERSETVDQLSPNERHKVATSRISQMFAKREQRQKPKSMMITAESLPEHANSAHNTTSMVINPNYVREYDNVDKYGHFATSIAPNADNSNSHDVATNPIKKSTTPSSSSSRDMSEDDEPKVHNDDRVENDNGGHHHPNQPDESPFQPQAVPRRSKHKLMHGNPMLIDELKKRQSTLYQAAE